MKKDKKDKNHNRVTLFQRKKCKFVPYNRVRVTNVKNELTATKRPQHDIDVITTYKI